MIKTGYLTTLTLALCLCAAPAAVPAAESPAGKAAGAETTPSKKAPSKPYKKALPKAPAVQLKTKQQRVGYAVGYNNGYGLKKNLEAQSIAVDLDAVKRGFTDAMTDAASAMSEQDIRSVLTDLQKDLDEKRKSAMAKEQELQREQGEKNRKEGEAFLKDNATKEGVKTLPDGLQYVILAEGTGKKPSATDTVVVNYRGTLVNGTEFDSSFKRGQPLTFPLNQVIKGWTEGIQLIKEGGKIRLFIPANLAYGERSIGTIGPNSTLIFEVDLISVQPATAPVTAPTATKH